MVNVWAALVSTPPFAVPPSSCSCTVTVVDPFASGARLYDSVPLTDTVG